MRQSMIGTFIAMLFVIVGMPTWAFQKQVEVPWWVNLQAQYHQAQDDGLRFEWQDKTQQIHVLGEVEFAFLGKSTRLDPRGKQLILKMYRNSVDHFWSLPFNATQERADVTACGRFFAGFNYDQVQYKLVDSDQPVNPGANRVYFYYHEQVPKILAQNSFFHATFPTITGAEGDFQDDPFWARKGEAVLPAYSQFLPLPMEAGTRPVDVFGARDASAASWYLFVGHEFGHALGLADGWFSKGDQIVATDTELMSYLVWELNPKPRTTHVYFADILARIFLCDVSWQDNGKTYWIGPEQ